MIFSDASDGDVIILPQSDHDGHYYLLKEPENELELLDFMQAIKDGKAERHGTSAIGRFVSDFLIKECLTILTDMTKVYFLWTHLRQAPTFLRQLV